MLYILNSEWSPPLLSLSASQTLISNLRTSLITLRLGTHHSPTLKQFSRETVSLSHLADLLNQSLFLVKPHATEAGSQLKPLQHCLSLLTRARMEVTHHV